MKLMHDSNVDPELLRAAKARVRREQFFDLLNSPRIFFRKWRSSYYEEKLVQNVRWCYVQEKK